METTKIPMKSPLVEMDGDEMTRVIWRQIKKILILPFVDMKTDYYDLGLANRDNTEDSVTLKAAEATKRWGVAVKCATVTANSQRMQEYGLKKIWKSPNATIRGVLDGTVFRVPILPRGIRSYVPGWSKPIILARHAYGDIYSAVDLSVDEPGEVRLVYRRWDGNEISLPLTDFKEPGIVMGMHNNDTSIRDFARTCMSFALEVGQDLYFGAKDTISPIYDGRFRDIFQTVFEGEYKQRFLAQGLHYCYTLIDDIVARVIRSNGGFVWACKNYDGDVMSDLVAAGYSSLAMMTSVLVTPRGEYEYEAAHGTVTRHYYRHLKGEKTSTNPMATLFAWGGALTKRGELDGLSDLAAFGKRIQNASLQTIEAGIMTGDLIGIADIPDKKEVDTESFLYAVAERL